MPEEAIVAWSSLRLLGVWRESDDYTVVPMAEELQRVRWGMKECVYTIQ